MRWCGEREPVSSERACAECKAPATHVRKDTVVGGGHRRSVYWCAKHGDPRAVAQDSPPKHVLNAVDEELNARGYWIGTRYVRPSEDPPVFDESREITPEEMSLVMYSIEMSAWENAGISLREKYGNAAIDAIGGADYHPEFGDQLRAEIKGLTDGGELQLEQPGRGSWSGYGAPRPLRDDEVKSIMRELLRRYAPVEVPALKRKRARRRG